MAEPFHSVAGVAIATGVVSSPVLLGMGAQPDALIVGLIMAILVSIWMPAIDKPHKAAAAVLFSSIIAGYGSPVAAEYIAGTVAAVTMSDALRLLMAAMIGACCPSLIPVALQFIGRKIGGAK